MKRLEQIVEKVQQELLPNVPLKLRQRFLVGVQAFSLRRFESINANGRSTANNRSTGESRVYRLTRDERFLELLPKMIASLVNKTTKEIRLSLDFSTFGSLQIACLALTTGKGRAIPIWLRVYLTKPKIGTMIPALISSLDNFLCLIDDTDRVIIAMDRWFAFPKLLGFLDTKGISFICRIKSGVSVEVAWDTDPVPIIDISHEETKCRYADLDLRLVRSNWDETMKEDEPWFLLTNNLDLSRQQILNRYAKRFEIEEFFKDIKWVQGYEWHQIKTKSVLEIIFLFVFLGWWLLREVMYSEVRQSRSKTVHPKKRLSIFKTCWELLHKESLPPQLCLVPT